MLTEQEKRKHLRSFALHLLLLALELAGAVIEARTNGARMFRYYTVLSNLFVLFAFGAAAWYELGILRGRRFHVPSWVHVLKYFSVCTVMVTLFVVLFILAPLMGGWRRLPFLLFYGAMLYHHLLCPLLAFVSLVFVDRPALDDPRLPRYAVLPTLAYGVVLAILNVLRVLRGPYPFLYVYEQPPWMSALWFVLIVGLGWLLAYLTWRCLRRFAERPWQPEPDAPDEAGGWTADGYIRDQDCFSAYTYRTLPASVNACGCVAAFDLRRAEGQSVSFADVLAEMDGMHLLRIPGPTQTRVMRAYLAKYLPGFAETRSREACLAALRGSRMGVLRYHEEQVPHFVAYLRTGEDAFRFFNVSDGAEDRVFTAEEFARGHLRGGPVRLFCWR